VATVLSFGYPPAEGPESHTAEEWIERADRLPSTRCRAALLAAVDRSHPERSSVGGRGWRPCVRAKCYIVTHNG